MSPDWSFLMAEASLGLAGLLLGVFLAKVGWE